MATSTLLSGYFVRTQALTASCSMRWVGRMDGGEGMHYLIWSV